MVGVIPLSGFKCVIYAGSVNSLISSVKAQTHGNLLERLFHCDHLHRIELDSRQIILLCIHSEGYKCVFSPQLLKGLDCVWSVSHELVNI